MEIIKSNQNKHVKNWKKLQTKKGRQASNSYLLEGWHLVNEALSNHQIITSILVVNAEYLQDLNLDKSVDVYLITDEIAKIISDTQSPQGIFAVVRIDQNETNIPKTLTGKFVLLDGLQDPGNIGTIVRTADAAGLDGVVFGDGTVDIFNPKVVRSMQGSQFHISLYNGNLIDWIKQFNLNKIPVYGTELNKSAVSLYDIKPGNDFALIMGNEGNGVSSEVLEMVQSVYIPMKGRAESLNVAIASGIAMFYLNK
ncbi:TrmH family RNA methyltransferase [Lentilactobacillus laojiaonis]|uniref:TrmH family RNA methyltransferase n=1 Tax=Lentilactobacillus laojiaonis TaxID=2883998 RepID=UPI001D0BA260|nr:RNA methyltransferase [Lentilactobacillus laojiaonis]UDM32606.1 RNA methyltransferase [Lentilactobacillus laojiaonis]